MKVGPKSKKFEFKIEFDNSLFHCFNSVLVSFIYRYKERLRTKFIKDKKPGESAHFLNGSNWTFIKDGLDDFRDGLPPNTDDIMIKVLLLCIDTN